MIMRQYGVGGDGGYKHMYCILRKLYSCFSFCKTISLLSPNNSHPPPFCNLLRPLLIFRQESKLGRKH